MSLRDFPLNLMETLKHWSSPQGYVVVFMFLTTVSKGLACEAPSSPECFRRTAAESVYMCEWSMNTTESDVTFDLYSDKKKIGRTKKTWSHFTEEQVADNYSPVHMWLDAHVGHSSCRSTRSSVVLGHTVKYETPQDISMSWLKNNLNLSWKAAEKHPALAEIWFRRDEQPTESWEKRTTNTTSDTSMYHVIVVNLWKDSAYQVQIRHRSTKARNPLWSDWSPVVTVPTELEQKPEVTMKSITLIGTRKVMLSWKPMPHAASVGGVMYSLMDTQPSHGCPCERRRQERRPIITDKHKHTIYVSFSAVNISVIARNAAGSSPPAIVQVPAEPAADLRGCEKTLLGEKLHTTTCLEWYEDGDPRPENVITLTARMRRKEKEIRKNIKNYTRYLYFEHRCDGAKPQTVDMCLFYQKEGAPLREPQHFMVVSETESSANLSWTAIPSEDQRGFLTHYSLCSVIISSQEEPRECRNISASKTTINLENLTPGVRYNISLFGVTRAGEGPAATLTINTWPEKPVNALWSLGLLFLFFFFTTVCTCILKRIKKKIFPPVPTPVIPDFIPYQPESQELLEKKEEEVHELTLLQLHPEVKSVPEDTEEPAVLTGGWDDSTDEEKENKSGHTRTSGGSSDGCLSPGPTDEALKSSREREVTDLEQLDNEIAMLIYRNGLVFDVKMDSH